jgi:hypothetical protein
MAITKAKRRAGHPACQCMTIRRAIRHLKQARNQLREAGSKSAADYVARALKSAEGAERHSLRMAHEAIRAAEGRGNV